MREKLARDILARRRSFPSLVSLGSEERRVLLETRVMVGVTLEVT